MDRAEVKGEEVVEKDVALDGQDGQGQQEAPRQSWNCHRSCKNLSGILEFCLLLLLTSK